MLNTTNRTIFKKVYGPVVNQELKELHETPDRTANVKIMRLQRLGHVIGVDQTIVAKEAFESKPEGPRNMGRPRFKWLED
jgi:hypothetical protein